MQKILDKLNDWCCKWRIIVNETKTKVLHFRPKAKSATDYIFNCGDKKVDVDSSYKYLGFWMNEYLDMKFSIREIAKSASRALGAVYSKFLCAGGMNISVYIKLVETMVEPILFFCSGIWGHINFTEIDSVLSKACRYYLGVINTVPMFLRWVTWDGVLVKSSKRSKQFVCGVACEICRNIELYGMSMNGLCVKVEHGSVKC